MRAYSVAIEPGSMAVFKKISLRGTYSLVVQAAAANKLGTATLRRFLAAADVRLT